MYVLTEEFFRGITSRMYKWTTVAQFHTEHNFEDYQLKKSKKAKWKAYRKFKMPKNLCQNLTNFRENLMLIFTLFF